MLSSQTVFVIGAGASKEVGMPIGSELRDIIAKKLHMVFGHGPTFIGQGDLQIVDCVKSLRSLEERERHFVACGVINQGIGLAASVDDFIDIHRDNSAIAWCAKLAIAASILENEQHSKLYYDTSDIYKIGTIDFGAIQDTWYMDFFRLVSNQVPTGGLERLFSSMAVVCFNYDRCIEQFLVHAVAAQYAIQLDAARSIVANLRIFRPYGSVGDYFGNVAFGASRVPPLENAVESLKTYTEQIQDNAQLEAMKNAIAEANTVVFLGTAFHANNMALIQPFGDHIVPKRIFATRAGISNEDLPRVHFALSKLRGINPPSEVLDTRNHFASTCYQLFDTYKLSLRA